MPEPKNFGELIKEIGDQPAFQNGNPVSDTILEEKAPASDSQPERGEKEPVTPSTDDGASEQRVPYSRFKQANEARRAAEAQAQEARMAFQQLLESRTARQEVPAASSSKFDGDMPSYWVKLYGDSDASREAYKYELERQADIEARAEQRAIAAIRAEAQTEKRIVADNLDVIDNRMEDLSAMVGRPLTEGEESAILDIVDEYTPKDDDGNYLGDTIGFDKAWSILQMAQSQQSSSSRRSRSRATALTSSRSEGEPTGNAASNAEFDPRDWNAYRKRI